VKRITHSANARDKLLHIETDGCIVNIRVGLTDSEGRRVTSVEILPEDETRAPDLDGHYWHLDGHVNSRVIRQPSTESDLCDECGARLPIDRASLVDDSHETSCSLHPDNVH
jgi:hypothetical protein